MSLVTQQRDVPFLCYSPEKRTTSSRVGESLRCSNCPHQRTRRRLFNSDKPIGENASGRPKMCVCTARVVGVTELPPHVMALSRSMSTRPSRAILKAWAIVTVCNSLQLRYDMVYPRGPPLLI